MTQLVIPAELGGLLQATAGYSQFPSVSSLSLMIFAKSNITIIIIVQALLKNFNLIYQTVALFMLQI